MCSPQFSDQFMHLPFKGKPNAEIVKQTFVLFVFNLRF